MFDRGQRASRSQSGGALIGASHFNGLGVRRRGGRSEVEQRVLVQRSLKCEAPDAASRSVTVRKKRRLSAAGGRAMIRPRSGIAKLFEELQAETGIPARRRSFHRLSPSIIPSHLGQRTRLRRVLIYHVTNPVTTVGALTAVRSRRNLVSSRISADRDG